MSRLNDFWNKVNPFTRGKAKRRAAEKVAPAKKEQAAVERARRTAARESPNRKRTPAAASRANGTIRLPRLTPGFRKAKPREQFWLKRTSQRVVSKQGQRRGKRGKERRRKRGSDGVSFTAKFSDEFVDCFAGTSYFGADKIDRWKAIENGTLPPDDETPTPPSAEARAQEEKEAIDPIVERGLREVEQIREPARERMEDLRRTAEQLSEQADETERDDPEAASILRARVEGMIDAIQEIAQEARAAIDRINERVDQERSEVRAALMSRYSAMDEAYDQRLAELEAGLTAEIESAIRANYLYEQQKGRDQEIPIDDIKLA